MNKRNVVSLSIALIFSARIGAHALGYQAPDFNSPRVMSQRLASLFGSFEDAGLRGRILACDPNVAGVNSELVVSRDALTFVCLRQQRDYFAPENRTPLVFVRRDRLRAAGFDIRDDGKDLLLIDTQALRRFGPKPTPDQAWSAVVIIGKARDFGHFVSDNSSSEGVGQIIHAHAKNDEARARAQRTLDGLAAALPRQ